MNCCSIFHINLYSLHPSPPFLLVHKCDSANEENSIKIFIFIGIDCRTTMLDVDGLKVRMQIWYGILQVELSNLTIRDYWGLLPIILQFFLQSIFLGTRLGKSVSEL